MGAVQEDSVHCLKRDSNPILSIETEVMNELSINGN